MTLGASLPAKLVFACAERLSVLAPIECCQDQVWCALEMLSPALYAFCVLFLLPHKEIHCLRKFHVLSGGSLKATFPRTIQHQSLDRRWGDTVFMWPSQIYKYVQLQLTFWCWHHGCPVDHRPTWPLWNPWRGPPSHLCPCCHSSWLWLFMVQVPVPGSLQIGHNLQLPVSALYLISDASDNKLKWWS
jgi:hypothetical protein